MLDHHALRENLIDLGMPVRDAVTFASVQALTVLSRKNFAYGHVGHIRKTPLAKQLRALHHPDGHLICESRLIQGVRYENRERRTLDVFFIRRRMPTPELRNVRP